VTQLSAIFFLMSVDVINEEDLLALQTMRTMLGTPGLAWLGLAWLVCLFVRGFYFCFYLVCLFIFLFVCLFVRLCVCLFVCFCGLCDVSFVSLSGESFKKHTFLVFTNAEKHQLSTLGDRVKEFVSSEISLPFLDFCQGGVLFTGAFSLRFSFFHFRLRFRFRFVSFAFRFVIHRRR
jgi:hypothetical protein